MEATVGCAEGDDRRRRGRLGCAGQLSREIAREQSGQIVAITLAICVPAGAALTGL